jgi:hypothetical protein
LVGEAFKEHGRFHMKSIGKLTVTAIVGTALGLTATGASDKSECWANPWQPWVRLQMPCGPAGQSDAPEPALTPAPPQPWGWAVSGAASGASFGWTSSGIIVASGATWRG